MATVYHRDQPGAPALVYANNVQSGFNAFKAIMKACLVDGYAGKPAAGWELINEGPGFLVLRNGSHSGYVCFTHFSSAMRVFVAETYTGMNGDIIAGAGVKSGNAAGSTLVQSVEIRYAALDTASSSWALVADAKTAVVAVYAHNNMSNVELTNAPSTASSFTLHVGEDSAGNFIAAGGAASNGTSSGAPVLAFDGGFTALKDPATGLLVGDGSLTLYISAAITASATTAIAAAAAAAVLPEATLVPIAWRVPGAWAGKLRGIALCPEVQNVPYPSIAAQCLGRPGPMYVRDGNQPIDLGDGHSYFVRAGYFYSMFYLITDNPEFW